MKHSPPNSCNVLQLGADRRQLWRFSTGSGDAKLSAEQAAALDAPLPRRWIAKGWSTLLDSRLNIAWLPSDQVFLRVVQLPKCESPDELRQMVEFQLEKLSPLPVGQIAWSVEPVPSHSSMPSELQTAIVVIVARHIVEAFLGQLESRGFLADRIELPMLHQLLATKVEGDGAWIYPLAGGGKATCLIAWWHGGTLQNVGLAHLSTPENWGRELGDQLTKTAWAGELEGWLTSAPKWHLVADPPTTKLWEPLLPESPGQAIERTAPLESPALAALTAQRAARAESQTNLVPDEFRARYHQQFVDRVWMRGLGALAVIYMAGVLAYFGFLYTEQARKAELEKEVAAFSGSYTNTLLTEARIQILQQQIILKNAVLEALKAASEKLPTDLTLTDFSFSRGKSLLLVGTTPADKVEKITAYNEDLRKYELKGAPLFTSVTSPSIGQGIGPQTMRWQFTCELKSLESE